jgi:hypothetical protein
VYKEAPGFRPGPRPYRVRVLAVAAVRVPLDAPLAVVAALTVADLAATQGRPSIEVFVSSAGRVGSTGLVRMTGCSDCNTGSLLRSARRVGSKARYST